MNDGADQKKLLVARNKEQRQKICSRMLQMPTKQDATYEKGWRATSFKDTRRTIARNQYQHYWTITEIQQEKHYCSHSRSIYKNGLTQGNNDECIIREDCKDLSQ